MTNYTYTAVDERGKTLKGQIQADSIALAHKALKANGKTPLTINEPKGLEKQLNLSFNSKPKPRELAVFCRQFVSIFSAGVPLISAFEMLEEQTENIVLSSAIGKCCVGIRQGMSLSEAMKSSPKVFSGLFVTMVASGEASGSLETSFSRMATQFEKQAKLMALVRRSSAYPIVVFIISIGVVIGLLTFVVPSFEEILSDLNAEMPAFSRVVINAGKFMQSNWYFVIAFIFAFSYFIYLFSKTPGGTSFFSALQLKLPLFGILATKTAAARTCRTLSTLISAGVPHINAIEIAASTMTNKFFKESLLKAKDEVMLGTPLSEPILSDGIFPKLMGNMIKIGEQSGDLEAMLDKLADYFEDEVENSTATLLTALEPLIIVFIAVIIITIVLAVMLPMMSIYEGLDNI